jgi:hypothetical protein
VTPEDERLELVRPRRLGRRGAVAWLILAVIVLGAIATLLVWVAHRLHSVAA